VSQLTDLDADCFFRAGDDGTYEGGPAHSRPPSKPRNQIDDETRPESRAEAVLARRAKLTKWVAVVVVVLALEFVLAVAFR
jgi:hypothetical protein